VAGVKTKANNFGEPDGLKFNTKIGEYVIEMPKQKENTKKPTNSQKKEGKTK